MRIQFVLWLRCLTFALCGSKVLEGPAPRQLHGQLVNVDAVYRQSGKLVDKYDVVNSGREGGGEYSNQDCFGWTNGVTRRLLDLYLDVLKAGATPHCP